MKQTKQTVAFQLKERKPMLKHNTKTRSQEKLLQ